MQIENVKISPAEVNNFPTALKWRRLAFGMEHEDVSELLGGKYTPLEVWNWEAGVTPPSDEEKAVILATLTYVQNELLDVYQKIVQSVTHLRLAAPIPLYVALLSPSTQEEYEKVCREMSEKMALVAYRRLLDMLHERLGLPVVTISGEPDGEEIFS